MTVAVLDHLDVPPVARTRVLEPTEGLVRDLEARQPHARALALHPAAQVDGEPDRREERRDAHAHEEEHQPGNWREERAPKDEEREHWPEWPADPEHEHRQIVPIFEFERQQQGRDDERGAYDAVASDHDEIGRRQDARHGHLALETRMEEHQRDQARVGQIEASLDSLRRDKISCQVDEHDEDRSHECRYVGANFWRVVPNSEDKARGRDASALTAAALLVKAFEVVGNRVALAGLVKEALRLTPVLVALRDTRRGGALDDRSEEGRAAGLENVHLGRQPLVVDGAREPNRVREPAVLWHRAEHLGDAAVHRLLLELHDDLKTLGVHWPLGDVGAEVEGALHAEVVHSPVEADQFNRA
mmetsp:Transcript_16685/g.35430  ORF Transcript_16685/g.35430 Transcript_16685/m.35430 type:complete len:359 (+) Transcript_16685:957-2033(+)